MSGRVVSPEEARKVFEGFAGLRAEGFYDDGGMPLSDQVAEHYAYTVFTEPERTRALRERAEKAERAWGEEAEMHRRKVEHIADEPERTRAAVVKALGEAAERARNWSHSAEDAVLEYRDAIENGADW